MSSILTPLQKVADSSLKPQTNTQFVILVSMVAALGGVLFGFDTAVISGAIPFIKSYFHLNEFSLGWSVSAILIGCAVGAPAAGFLAEKYGRRWVLISCSVLFAFSGVGAGLAGDLWMFIGFRLIGGVGVGAAAMVSPMYIAEVAPSSLRGRLVSMYQLAIVLGILLAYFSNYLLSDIGKNNWRWMFAAQTVPAVLFGILLFFVPESPRWLIKKGRIRDAKSLMCRISGVVPTENEVASIRISFENNAPVTIRMLFSHRYFPILLIGVLIAVFQQVTGINAIMYYAPEIFKATGLSTASSLVQTISVGVVNVLATFLAIFLIEKTGRKKLLWFGSLLMGLSLLTIGICFYFQYFSHYIVLILMLLYVASFCCTLGAVTWVYLSEIFPNRIRSLALSAATLVLWLADFAVSYTFPILAEKLGTAFTLFTYSFFCFISFFFVLYKVPETKGRTLEEIENLFHKS